MRLVNRDSFFSIGFKFAIFFINPCLEGVSISAFSPSSLYTLLSLRKAIACCAFAFLKKSSYDFIKSSIDCFPDVLLLEVNVPSIDSSSYYFDFLAISRRLLDGLFEGFLDLGSRGDSFSLEESLSFITWFETSE